MTLTLLCECFPHVFKKMIFDDEVNRILSATCKQIREFICNVNDRRMLKYKSRIREMVEKYASQYKIMCYIFKTKCFYTSFEWFHTEFPVDNRSKGDLIKVLTYDVPFCADLCRKWFFFCTKIMRRSKLNNDVSNFWYYLVHEECVVDVAPNVIPDVAQLKYNTGQFFCKHSIDDYFQVEECLKNKTTLTGDWNMVHLFNYTVGHSNEEFLYKKLLFQGNSDPRFVMISKYLYVNYPTLFGADLIEDSKQVMNLNLHVDVLMKIFQNKGWPAADAIRYFSLHHAHNPELSDLIKKDYKIKSSFNLVNKFDSVEYFSWFSVDLIKTYDPYSFDWIIDRYICKNYPDLMTYDVRYCGLTIRKN